MLSFEEAKTQIKSLVEELGLVLVDEHSRELYVKLAKSASLTIKIPEEEITEFQQLSDTIASAKNSPVETSIIGDNFREQLVDLIGRQRLSPLLLRDTAIKFGTEGDEQVFVEVGGASPTFYNYFRFRRERKPFFFDRLNRFIGNTLTTMRDFMPKLQTIRVQYASQQTENHLEKVSGLLESCLFELSYMTNIHAKLRNEWPSAQVRKQVTQRRASPRSLLPLRKVRYDTPVVKFYQRGVATDDAYIQFVSFYHVLEFYFVAVSDSILYDRLSRLINDPTFRSVPKHLDKLISATDEHKRVNDETEMLRNVLHAYVGEKEIIEFIQTHEEGEKVKTFTEKNECFGQELEKITIREGHVLGHIAKRIKTIRNTLVHSSDRYERRDRYLPGVEADRIIQREIPLLKFIAERVIVATAHPME